MPPLKHSDIHPVVLGLFTVGQVLISMLAGRYMASPSNKKIPQPPEGSVYENV